MFGTVKSVELLGLVSFNIFLAIVLSVTFLGQPGTSGNKLTETGITDFINEATNMSTGAAKDADQFGVTKYLMSHIQDGSIFNTSIQYDIPGVDGQQRSMAFNKNDYISHVIEGLKAMHDREATTHIESIEIKNGATEARVVTTSTEHGKLPVASADGDQPTLVPVRGVSYCEQTLVLKDQTIQMAGATCSTNIETADSDSASSQ
jgi:hypothetical protein